MESKLANFFSRLAAKAKPLTGELKNVFRKGTREGLDEVLKSQTKFMDNAASATGLSGFFKKLVSDKYVKGARGRVSSKMTNVLNKEFDTLLKSQDDMLVNLKALTAKANNTSLPRGIRDVAAERAGILNKQYDDLQKFINSNIDKGAETAKFKVPPKPKPAPSTTPSKVPANTIPEEQLQREAIDKVLNPAVVTPPTEQVVQQVTKPKKNWTETYWPSIKESFEKDPLKATALAGGGAIALNQFGLPLAQKLTGLNSGNNR